MTSNLNDFKSVLVSYSDSESETSKNETNVESNTQLMVKNDKNLENNGNRSEKIKLPIPEKLEKLFVKNETKDEIESSTKQNHQGRVRSFPHVVGNWATHIYLPIEFDRDQLILVNRLNSYLKSLNYETHLCEDFHISLSKTFPIKRHTIEPLWKSINSEFQEQVSFSSNINRVNTFTNDEKTRTFIGFEIEKSECTVYCDLIKNVDNCLKQFKLPTYYKNPKIHISFAWCLNDLKSDLDKNALNKLNELFTNYQNNSSNIRISIDKLKFNSGNRVFTRKFTTEAKILNA